MSHASNRVRWRSGRVCFYSTSCQSLPVSLRATLSITFDHRMTGASAPRGVPRDSDGNERPAAFFEADGSGASPNQRSSPNQKRQSNGNGGKSARKAEQDARKGELVVGRRAGRPDMYVMNGERGR